MRHTGLRVTITDALDRIIQMIVTAGPPFRRCSALELLEQVATGQVTVSWAADLVGSRDVAMLTVRAGEHGRLLVEVTCIDFIGSPAFAQSRASLCASVADLACRIEAALASVEIEEVET